MAQTYSAIVKHSGDCWVGWTEEVAGVSGREPTRAKSLPTRRTALAEALGFNREEGLGAAGADAADLPIAA